MIDLTFRNIAQSFKIKQFPSGIFLKGIVVLFAVLAVIGAAVFGYHSSEIGLYTNDGYYLLYIKFLPKALLLFFLVWHNLKNGISTPASPDNRFFYFISMLLGLAFFTILFFIIKEFAGTIAQVSLERLKNNMRYYLKRISFKNKVRLFCTVMKLFPGLTWSRDYKGAYACAKLLNRIGI